MSRYEFEQPGVSIAIGWDAPLATFYLQVWSEALQTADMDEEDRATPQIWLGGEYAEYPEPEAVLAVARAHDPTIPEELYRILRIDQLAAPARALHPDHESVARMMRLLTNGRIG